MSKNNTSPEAVPNCGRETSGRFAKGNPGGPGNPFARQTAALRQAMLDAVTPQDITDIMTILVFNAKAGDLASVKFLFQHVIGKPKPAVEPDTLDLNELQLLQASVLPGEAVLEFTGKAPTELALRVLRTLLPAMTKLLSEQLAAPPPEGEAEEEETPVQEAPTAPSPPAPGRTERCRQAPPSRNGVNGYAEPVDEDEPLDWNDESPSRNGSNGALGALARLMRLIPPPEPESAV